MTITSVGSIHLYPEEIAQIGWILWICISGQTDRDGIMNYNIDYKGQKNKHYLVSQQPTSLFLEICIFLKMSIDKNADFSLKTLEKLQTFP